MFIPDYLKTQIANKKCIAFVGAGFSIPAGMPSWIGLLEKIYKHSEGIVACEEDNDRRKYIRTALDCGDIMLAAAVAQRIYTTSQLNQLIADCYSRDVFNNAKIMDKELVKNRLEKLLGIRWAGIITTNYDDLIEMGLENSDAIRTHQATESQLFGHSLASCNPTQRFFTKLHGTIRNHSFVLGPAEYDRVYLADPKIANYLTAVMLSYHVVFIGCSLEDEILRLRRQLCINFEGEIPLAYALMPETDKNVARFQDLKEFARIQCLMYPEDEHQSLDDFLGEIRNECGENSSITSAFNDNIIFPSFSGLSTADKLDKVGKINACIYNFIRGSDSQGSIRKSELPAGFRTLDEDGIDASSLSDAEITYRALFMVSIGLLRLTANENGDQSFSTALA